MHSSARRIRLLAILSTTSALAALAGVQGAQAQCDLVATAGDDSLACSSGTHAGDFDDLAGNNMLTFPDGGSGTIDGNVTFGAGTDSVEVHSGTVTGNVQQGSGIDDFQMTGGTIQSLSQGDNLDTFFMSEGRIIDFFEDGDHAVMTGGRIGRVNMKLDDNLFDMSGGTIDKNLVAGFGNDTIILSNGTIGGNISVSGGTDSVTVTGGTVGGNVLMSFGTDTFTWDGGGIIYGAIDLGGDNDTARLSNLTNANVGDTDAITGGLGTDNLTLDNVSMGGVERLQNWETIDATNDTELTFDGNLTLGDSGTGTGTLTVDSTSTLFGGGANVAVTAFTAGQLANVVNSGRIDLTNGGGSTSDTFTISGNYTGHDGLLFLNTVLGNDASPSDKLVIDGGTASGSTFMEIVNTGGGGGLTTQDGILVVDATNGTTTPGAFALGGRVAAGAYEYLLFKGGVAGGNTENWYLRSSLAATGPQPAPSAVTPTPEPEEPEAAPPPPASELPPVPTPTEGDATTDPVDPTPPIQAADPEPEAPPAPPAAEEPTPPPPVEEVQLSQNPAADLPRPNPDRIEGDGIPLYRVEVPTYVAVPPIAHYLAVSTLGTFHERRGEQALLEGAGFLPTAWARVLGQDTEMAWTGTLTPTFDGRLFGLQAGFDLFGWESGSDQHDRVGVFFSYTRMNGDVNSPTIGGIDAVFGDINANGTSLAATWTRIGSNGWYLDGVVMGTWFGGDATSSAGESINIDGTGVALSLEGGYPIALTPRWTIEPQAQIIWHHLSLDNQADNFSTVSFDADDGVTGRLGFRLQGSFQTEAATFQPYLKANLWHEFDDEDRISFATTPIVTERGGTSLEIGGGVVAKLTDATSFFATAGYTTNLGGEKKRVFKGNIGLSVKW